jgi:dipeptidyl-peptidase-4
MMFVYGGPESQEVRDEWGTSSWHYLLLQKGYMVVCVDNRGTDGKGEEFRKSTYMQLGKLEFEDQVAAGRYLGTLDYVDPDRIGIWGSSYGGYMASLCITRGGGVFRLAIAISPVTSWRYYDTIYTERFMRTPQENPHGYDAYSPLYHADKMQGKFMLAHGMVDDNVHFQNSVDFADALIDADKDFEMLIYRDSAHSIHGRAVLHLIKQMTRFVLENL